MANRGICCWISHLRPVTRLTTLSAKSSKYSTLCSSRTNLIRPTMLGLHHKNSLITVHKRYFNVPIYCMGLIFFLNEDTRAFGIPIMILGAISD